MNVSTILALLEIHVFPLYTDTSHIKSPAIDTLLDNGLIRQTEAKQGEVPWETTEKAHAYIDALRGTSLPVQKWEIPE